MGSSCCKSPGYYDAYPVHASLFHRFLHKLLLTSMLGIMLYVGVVGVTIISISTHIVADCCQMLHCHNLKNHTIHPSVQYPLNSYGDTEADDPE